MRSLTRLSSGISIWVTVIVGVLAVGLPLLRPTLTSILRTGGVALNTRLTLHDISIPKNSYFPAGCVWREIKPQGSTTFWQKREYEYIIRSGNSSCHANVSTECSPTWGREQPLACRLQTSTLNRILHHYSNLETILDCTESHCIIDNLWYNNGLFYGIFEKISNPYETMALTQDIELNALHVHSSREFARQVVASRVAGSTLLIDFVYFTHPVSGWMVRN